MGATVLFLHPRNRLAEERGCFIDLSQLTEAVGVIPHGDKGVLMVRAQVPFGDLEGPPAQLGRLADLALLRQVVAEIGDAGHRVFVLGPQPGFRRCQIVPHQGLGLGEAALMCEGFGE